MTITSPTPATGAIPMAPLRRTASLAGGLYLITFVALGVWLVVEGSTPSPVTAALSGEPPAAVSRV